MIEADFERHYGRRPQWVARAPGRVNLIGEHTDYNEGFVLPMAIELDTRIAAAPNGSSTVNLRSTVVEESVSIDLARLGAAGPGPKGRWVNYPGGVLAGFAEAGYAIAGFDALIQSTVPLGGGLSSSASLEVAVATMLEAMLGERLDPVAKAELCQRAEHRYAQVPCGLMDQFICTLGRENHLLLLDCRSRKTEWIEFADPGLAVLIVKTNVRHELANGEYALRRRQCEAAARHLGLASLRDATCEGLRAQAQGMDPILVRRARHVLTENHRVLKTVRAIGERDWNEVGQLMYASHESLKEDFEVSCAELDTVVAIAQKIGVRGGVLGCRMTGGGFGGCAVALIRTEAEAAIRRNLSAQYQVATGIEPTLFLSHPARGATLESP